MKKLILFLLLPLWMVAQTSSGMEQEFDYGIKNNSTQTITTPPYLTTTGIDGTQGKIPASLIALKSDLPVSYTKVVYVNTTSPSTATIFDDVNPPVTNDNLLKSDAANLYIGTDASTWVWNSSSYVTKVVPDGSNFWIYGTNIPAGSNKNEPIVRTGDIFSDGNITAGLSLRSDNVQTNAVSVAFETANTIASFDAGKQLRSLPTDTYPSLTELSYAKGVTSGIQAQINGKADLDSSGKVLLSQINDALLGSVNYKGTYNATTNVPTIPTATSSNKGWYYIISTTGTQQGYNFVNGDWIISNGTSWGKVDNNNTVTSVNGQVGAVSVTTSSIGAQTTLTNPLTGAGSQNDPSTYALQDGTILYHSTKWFVPTGTVSTSGATVTSVGTQFTSGMVGAKLTINGEWRIITGYTSSTVVAVASAYSQDYSGVVAGSWGVYSKSFETISNNQYTPQGSLFTSYSGTDLGAIAYKNYSSTFRLGISSLDYQSSGAFRFSSTSFQDGTKDLGIRRNTAGVLEIYDGVTADGAIGNRRDLLARNYTGSATLTGTPTAPTAPVGTNTTQIATTAFVRANSMNIPHLRFNNTDKTIWNNGKGGVASNLSYGEGALSALTTGTNSLAIGYQALVKATTGEVNLAFGNFTLNNLINGADNTGIGTSALSGIVDGSYNVALGGGAGRFYGSSGSNNNTSSTNSIFLGNSTRASSSTVNNEIVIGSNAVGSGSNTATIGSSSIIKTVLRGVINYSTPYTVATLPAGTRGDTAFVTDATAPTYLGTLTGGGSVVCPVFYNGTAWVAH